MRPDQIDIVTRALDDLRQALLRSAAPASEKYKPAKPEPSEDGSPPPSDNPPIPIPRLSMDQPIDLRPDAPPTGPLPAIDLMALDALTVLSPPQAAGALSLSLDTLKRLHRRGEGPRRVRLGIKRVGYLVRDLRTWIEKLSAT
jgi:predicted DNA-binding transcriptional regulator AlpA